MRRRQLEGRNRAKRVAVKNIAKRALRWRSSPKKIYSAVAFFLLLLALVNSLDFILETLFDNDDGNRYLLFYGHSGFSNQLIGMERVAYLALVTNRTLVLPPVLPHATSKKAKAQQSFPEFIARTSGIGCLPFDRYHGLVEVVKDDVKKARDPKLPFPSFMDLFDFKEFKKAGLKVVDMTEFAKHKENTRFGRWCKGPKNEIEKKMIPYCDKGDKLSFRDLVPYFRKTCSLDRRVAVIGASYVMPRADPNEIPSGLEVHQTFRNMNPSRKMLSLVREVHSRLPTGYAGVHIRFKDGLVINDCDDPTIKKSYEKVMIGLKENAVPTGSHVLIGNGNRAALLCFNRHAQGLYTASTINSVIDSDESLRKMVDKIKSENSTIYLLLDQILIGVAEKVVLTHAGSTASTFHSKIRHWHGRREMILQLHAHLNNNTVT